MPVRTVYKLKFELWVVNELRSMGKLKRLKELDSPQQTIADVFNISESLVSQWGAKERELEEALKKGGAARTNVPPHFATIIQCNAQLQFFQVLDRHVLGRLWDYLSPCRFIRWLCWSTFNGPSTAEPSNAEYGPKGKWVQLQGTPPEG